MQKLLSGAVLAVCAALTMPVATAENYMIADVNLNADSVRGRLVAATQDADGNGAQLDLGYLFIDDGSGEDLGVAHGGILAVGDAAGTGNSNILLGVGARLYGLDADEANGFAVGLGGAVRSTIPHINRLALGMHLYYAPDITAFNDIEAFLEYEIRAEYEILRNARLYTGYRQVKADFDNGAEETLDSGFLGGFQLVF